MGFFFTRNISDTKDERDSDEDDLEFHAIFEINDLATPEIDDEREKTAVPMTPVNQGVASSNNHAEMDSIKSINETHGGEKIHESGNNFSGYENRIELQSELHHAMIWNNKGVVLSKMGLFAQSIEAFDRAIQLYPEYCNAWNNKGVALSRLGQYEKAIEAYDQALQINLDHSSSYQNQDVLSPGIVTST